MDYEHDSPEYEAFWDGYRQATNYELRGGQAPAMPEGYSAEQARAWGKGKSYGYQDA